MGSSLLLGSAEVVEEVGKDFPPSLEMLFLGDAVQFAAGEDRVDADPPHVVQKQYPQDAPEFLDCEDSLGVEFASNGMGDMLIVHFEEGLEIAAVDILLVLLLDLLHDVVVEVDLAGVAL